jgi:hypothetical protein
MWANDPRVEIHGPGYSKVIIGEDCVDDWEQYLDVMVASIADNGGRSCVNASAVWAPAHAEEISEALASDWRRSFRAPQTTRTRSSHRLSIRKSLSASTHHRSGFD